MSERNAELARLDPRELVERLRACLPLSNDRIPLHEPRFTGREREYVDDCIDTGWVSYAGSYVGKFEALLAERCGVPHAIAVSSGTVALKLCVEMAGVERGDEVLVPAFTFVASANAIVHSGAIPHFADIEPGTLGLSASKLRDHLRHTCSIDNGRCINRMTGRRISAVMPVHIFGHPVEMDAIVAVAADFGLAVIEDAAEAIGSRYKDRPCGSLAPLAALSFNGNKIVTTGGGGAVLTLDEKIATRLRHLTTTAKLPHPWGFYHDDVGYNFRMPNINAALGVGQIEHLDQMLAAKRDLWAGYDRALGGLEGVRLFREQPGAHSNYWLIALVLDRADPDHLEAVIAALNAAGIGARPAWTPLHKLPMYRDHPRMDLSVTEDYAARVINIPSSPHLARRA